MSYRVAFYGVQARRSPCMNNFDMVGLDVEMSMRRLTSLKLLLLLTMVLPRYVKLSVFVTGCAQCSDEY